jgi:SAM-dependent methyltransferase
VLDIGCGEGYFLDLLKNAGIDAIGYEFTPNAAAVARGKGHTVYTGSFPAPLEGALTGERFDALSLFQVLEHSPDPVGFLKSARSLLRPGGLLVITLPDSEGPARYFPESLTEIPPHHVSQWCESAFRVGLPRLRLQAKRILREPLPDYLWHSYLPVMWDSEIWPAAICRSLDPDEKMGRIERILWFIERMKQMNVKRLYGVPGPTLYAVVEQIEMEAGTWGVEHGAQSLDRVSPVQEGTEPSLGLCKFLSDVESRFEESLRFCTIDTAFRLGKRAAALARSEALLVQREGEFANRESELAKNEGELAKSESELAQREGEMAVRFQEREASIARRELQLAAIMNTWTYRIAKAALWPAAKLRHSLRG